MHGEPVTLAHGHPSEGLVTLWVEPPGTCREKMGKRPRKGEGGEKERSGFWFLGLSLS